jgi:hypothetical protein
MHCVTSPKALLKKKCFDYYGIAKILFPRHLLFRASFPPNIILACNMEYLKYNYK